MSEPMVLTARAAVPIDDVRHALTDPATLRIWLAEHAEVDLPRRFVFWGRYTPEGEAPHQRVLHVDDHTLRFAWLLDGEDTTVEIQLAESGADATILTLTQTHFDFQDVIDDASIRGVLHAFWALSIANLVDHLEGRELTARCDFTSSELPRAQVLIGASREAVFDSIVDSEKVTAWFGIPIGIEPWVGGRFAVGGLDVDGPPARIVELVPGRKLAIDWGDWGVTTWELEDSAGQTRLTFVQSGFTTQRPPYSGWMGTVAGIADLRRYHELKDWRPIRLSAEISV